MFIRNGWRWLGASIVAASIAALLPTVVFGQQTTQYRASLVGANEVPPTTSTATGTFTATLDEAAGTLAWSLSVPTITNVTAAHLHQGAATCVCPVVLPLFAAPAGSPASSINVSGTSRVGDLTGPLAGNFAGFVAALKGGTIYVNAHTTANPIGEIRATVTLVQPAAAPVPPKSGNGGLAATTSTNGSQVVALLALTVVILGGGRALTARRRR